jgi:hypothetical protein
MHDPAPAKLYNIIIRIQKDSALKTDKDKIIPECMNSSK